MLKFSPKARDRLQPGQLVDVRSFTEIAATLDSEGRLGGMPFMPEMLGYCGRRFRIHQHAHKTCVEGVGLRLIDDVILLDEVRCDGAAHDGCERRCLIFWKSAWLKAVDDNDVAPALVDGAITAVTPASLVTRNGGRYVCQSTELLAATKDLARFDFSHYFAEIRDRQLSVFGFAYILVRTAINLVRRRFGLPDLGGIAGRSARNTRGNLHLHAGEIVEINSRDEIAGALDAKGRNCGLSFDPNMSGFIGGRFEVEYPVTRIILEQTGQMAKLANTVALKGVVCEGLCTKNCPRRNPIYWREAWLRRVGPAKSEHGADEAPKIAVASTATPPAETAAWPNAIESKH